MTRPYSIASKKNGRAPHRKKCPECRAVGPRDRYTTGAFAQVRVADHGTQATAKVRSAFEVVADSVLNGGRLSGATYDDWTTFNANKAVARLLLRDVVPQLLARYPDVELGQVCEGRLVDIVECMSGLNM